MGLVAMVVEWCLNFFFFSLWVLVAVVLVVWFFNFIISMGLVVVVVDW